MFRAMFSQQQMSGCQGNGSQNSGGMYQPSHSVASTLAQIGVDPGYYSDSECSSNSSEKVTDEQGNVSPQQSKLTRIPEQQPQVINPSLVSEFVISKIFSKIILEIF